MIYVLQKSFSRQRYELIFVFLALEIFGVLLTPASVRLAARQYGIF